MNPHPPPLDYAGALTPASPGTGPRIDQSERELNITVPPGRLWTMLLAPGIAVTFGAAVLLVTASITIQTIGRGRYDDLVCPMSAFVVVGAVTWAALDALIRAARYGGAPAILRASADSLIISNPSRDGKQMRRWTRGEIAYVLVERSSITASLGFIVTVSIITSEGGKDSGMDIFTRDGSMHGKLERLINQYLGISPPLGDHWPSP